MKTALYRKWRPQTFADVIGQDAVCAALLNQLRSGRVSHAYIFTGIRGTGKTTLAKILAKAVNCENPRDGEPCGKCASCRGIDDGSILDVTEIDAASNNGVDNIRDLRDETAFAPAVCKMRVYIIDEVHMLSTGAFNALLKTLEEPPAHVMFILATTEIHKVPATILSRCQRFDLKRISAAAIEARLLYIAGQEGIDLAPDGAKLLARLADGAMRDALSLLDTCASLGGTVDEQTVMRLAGVADKSYLFELTDDLRAGDAPALLARLAALYEDSVDAPRLCAELLRHLRNLLMTKVTGAPPAGEGSEETMRRYGEQSARFTVGELLAALDALGDTADRLGASLDRMLTLELCLLRLCEANAGALPTQAAPAQTASARTAPAPASPAPARKEEQPPTQTAPAQTVPAQEIAAPAPAPGALAVWPQIVSELRAQHGMLYGFLANSHAYVTDTHVLIDAGDVFLNYIRENPDAKQAIKDAIEKVSGIRLPIGPYKHKKGAAPAAAPLQGKLDDLLRRAADSGIETEIR
ncbi:MAG: DNA polymerase III subunit gamma/tau [Oscillospiraceae bacterium]|nr:DNA polymerase III subunit gamma/tau [Oscillospiraceae bacterium]